MLLNLLPSIIPKPEIHLKHSPFSLAVSVQKISHTVEVVHPIWEKLSSKTLSKRRNMDDPRPQVLPLAHAIEEIP